MSVDMLQRKRSTTIPAVLNNRSLGTLVAGTDSSLAATAAMAIARHTASKIGRYVYAVTWHHVVLMLKVDC